MGAHMPERVLTPMYWARFCWIANSFYVSAMVSFLIFSVWDMGRWSFFLRNIEKPLKVVMFLVTEMRGLLQTPLKLGLILPGRFETQSLFSHILEEE